MLSDIYVIAGVQPAPKHNEAKRPARFERFATSDLAAFRKAESQAP